VQDPDPEHQVCPRVELGCLGAQQAQEAQLVDHSPPQEPAPARTQVPHHRRHEGGDDWCQQVEQEVVEVHQGHGDASQMLRSSAHRSQHAQR
ncbi:hypothetical protein PAXRUDRAFT_763639, partial [Paxillus rubicundulus Ve08.2h10]